MSFVRSGAVEVQVVGAGALNQAIKAVAIARGYVAAAASTWCACRASPTSPSTARTAPPSASAIEDRLIAAAVDVADLDDRGPDPVVHAGRDRPRRSDRAAAAARPAA